MDIKKAADLANGELVRIYDAASNDFVLALTTTGPAPKQPRLALLLNDKPEVIVIQQDALIISFGLNYNISALPLAKLSRGFADNDLLSLYLLCGVDGYRLR